MSGKDGWSERSTCSCFLAERRLRKETVRANGHGKGHVKINRGLIAGTKTAATLTGMTRKFTTGTTLTATIFPRASHKKEPPAHRDSKRHWCVAKPGLPGWKRRFLLARPSWFATSLRRRRVCALLIGGHIGLWNRGPCGGGVDFVHLELFFADKTVIPKARVLGAPKTST